MPQDNEIAKVARVVIGRHGKGAEVAAERRSARLVQDGQFNAASIWRRIRAAIRLMQPTGADEPQQAQSGATKKEPTEASGS